ncbi:hypothetical protein OPV22_008798 [Ensete ventricosum]|uniref:Uncharacterized protein n=1 Tax=Ensete ventricosum TaxID=4639 RepID=A0AAV8RDK8_ENSVE|nr:hypothetical protein OPV22_008798 [Ensete ventricosum]
MAYRRRHSTPRSATFEEFRSFSPEEDGTSSPSLAAKAIRASAAHRESSLSSAYDGDSAAFSSSSSSTSSSASSAYTHPGRRNFHKQGSNVYEYSSLKSSNGPRHGFWEVLAKKAKAILEDDTVAQQFEDHDSNHSQILDSSGSQLQTNESLDSYCKTENSTFQKDAITSSLKEFGGTIKNAFEEGISIMENKTADIIHEPKKLQIGRKTESSDTANQPMYTMASTNLAHNETEYETQLKASQKVANAMAAKAKLLMRELKTVKADMAFAKQRCAQLEEENKVLRENRQKGDNPADDDLIRHQLETLLAEKARLVHDNTVYERENLFLREIVEYHQLTMQDVVYLDEGIEEVTEVYPIHQIKTLSSPSCSAYETSTAGNSCPATLRSNTMLSLSTDASGFGSLSSPDSPNRTFIVKKVADGEVNPLPSPAAEGSMQQHSPSPTPH